MSEARKIEEQIISYLVRLDEEQKKALLIVAKTFAKDGAYDFDSDPSFIAAIQARQKGIKAGKNKDIDFKEVLRRIRIQNKKLVEKAKKKKKNKK